MHLHDTHTKRYSSPRLITVLVVAGAVGRLYIHLANRVVLSGGGENTLSSSDMNLIVLGPVLALTGVFMLIDGLFAQQKDPNRPFFTHFGGLFLLIGIAIMVYVDRSGIYYWKGAS